jgi:hypothetical protein
MKYKTIKMDGRYTRYGFTHLVEFPKSIKFGTGVLDFDRSRRWFNDQFGWSQDVETRNLMCQNKGYNFDAYVPNDLNPVWAYAVRYDNLRIYVDTDKTLTWFMLCHPMSP